MLSQELSPLFWGRTAFFSGILLYLSIGILTFAALPGRVKTFEALSRNKWIGLFGGWIALALCVPHAVVVSPAFLLPFLWPLAVAVPILGFFFVDYPAARAAGGLLILLGYSMVHYTFDFRTPGFPAYAFLGWLTGIAGIWVSGKPCAMRDYFRMTAEKGWFRILCGVLWCLAALAAAAALITTNSGGGIS